MDNPIQDDHTPVINATNVISRRKLLGAIGLGIGGMLPVPGVHASDLPDTARRVVPSSGELIPALGMGTWITFNVGNSQSLRASRCRVLETFFELGGRMVDSSPMYGSSQEVVGHCTAELGKPESYLPTTKVWTNDGEQGQRQVEEAFRLWGVDQIALYQVHNLVAWRTHLPYLGELKQQGRISYIGVTTSHGSRHRELEQVMLSESLDFVQLTYNLQDRQAEDRLLPLAAERGIGVVVNRPFRRGALFDRLADVPLPEWATEIQCENMAQVMLKFIISHPAVTCAIPATSKVEHMKENMGALKGSLPDPAMRKQMAGWFDRI